MTNFDRIKAMSIEELAEFLVKTGIATPIKLNGTYIVREKSFITEWLGSEVEEE